MNVLVMRITILVLLVTLVGCYNSNGKVNSINTKENDIGVYMIIHSATPNGIYISLVNTTDENCTYGEFFLIHNSGDYEKYTLEHEFSIN